MIYTTAIFPVSFLRRILMTESVHLSFDAQKQPKESRSVDSDLVKTPSKPMDTDLFPDIENIQMQHQLHTLAPPYTNKGTVRIYAHSLHLKDPSFSKQPVHPSVITVERAALCQIFLETKYHKTFQQPSERDLRRQTLETLVSNGKELTTEQKFKFNEILKSVESEWSRLSRVRPSIDAFTIERKLGSGGFGVVNMVTEKQTGQVYAMKV